MAISVEEYITYICDKCNEEFVSIGENENWENKFKEFGTQIKKEYNFNVLKGDRIKNT